MNNSQVIIIGAGPGGIACATQLKRYSIESTLLEKDTIGGLVKNANLIENYTGFPDGITGKNFVSLLEKQVKSNSLLISYEKVELVEFNDSSFNVSTVDYSYKSDYLVLASGTKPIIPDIYKTNLKKGVFTDIYDLGEVKNKEIVIVGAGDCAFDYAMNLATNNRVIILNRSKRVKAIPILRDRVFEHEKIIYFEDTNIKNLKTDDPKLRITCNNKTFESDYLLIAVGRKPNIDFVGRQALENPNLFQIGDVKNGLYRQTSIAIGDGVSTAMKIYKLMTQ